MDVLAINVGAGMVMGYEWIGIVMGMGIMVMVMVMVNHLLQFIPEVVVDTDTLRLSAPNTTPYSRLNANAATQDKHDPTQCKLYHGDGAGDGDGDGDGDGPCDCSASNCYTLFVCVHWPIAESWAVAEIVDNTNMCLRSINQRVRQ